MKIIQTILLVILTFGFSKSGDVVFDTTGVIYTKLLNFELEVSTISDIFKKLGKSEIIISGDAGEYSKRFSYYLSSQNIFITFDVTEVGNYTTIHKYVLSESISDSLYQINSIIRINENDLGGLRIGMSRTKFLQIFGTLCRIDGDRIFISFHQKIPPETARKIKYIPDDSQIIFCDQSISLSAKFKNNKMIQLSLFKFTTY